MTVIRTDEGFAPASDAVRAPIRRRPALDGLRALAVAAVVVYHVDDNVLPGGFVGVDLFFVLSGYLITSLLLREHAASGSVSLREFWSRRIRRLWPLGWLLIGAVGMAGAFGVWAADQQRTLGSQSIAGLANVSNWWQMANGGYLEEFGDPSPLRHLWSLAVEEQMYVLWPLALIGLIRLSRRRGHDVVWIGIAVLSVASVGSAWFSTPERAYLATDSRAIGILVGAALAVAWSRHPLNGPRTVVARKVASTLGAIGAAVLVAACVTASPMSSSLHRGGFLLIALAGCGVVAAALSSTVARDVLSVTPLVWLGERSYAVYLIHWPLVVALEPRVPTWATWVLVIFGSLAGAALVHRLVERPVIARVVPARVLGLAAVALLVVLAVSLRIGAPVGPTPQEQLASTLDRVADPTTTAAPDVEGVPSGTAAPTTTTTCVPSVAAAPTFGGSDSFDSRTVDTVVDPGAACATQVRLLVLGDSTGRGISNGINSLGDPRVQVWDRTDLGCSYGPERCGDWREKWGINVLGVQPDVVLIYTAVQPDLWGVDDAPFLSEEAHQQRVATFSDAVRLASPTGAKDVLVRPALAIGTFYCNARNPRTTCTLEELAAWDRSLDQVAAATGATVLDVGAWVGQNTVADDRPDGLHLSGDALRRHAEWLVPQVVTVAGQA